MKSIPILPSRWLALGSSSGLNQPSRLVRSNGVHSITRFETISDECLKFRCLRYVSGQSIGHCQDVPQVEHCVKVWPYTPPCGAGKNKVKRLLPTAWQWRQTPVSQVEGTELASHETWRGPRAIRFSPDDQPLGRHPMECIACPN